MRRPVDALLIVAALLALPAAQAGPSEPVLPPEFTGVYDEETDTVILSWEALEGNFSYELFRGTMFLGSTSDSSFVDVSPLAFSVYQLRVYEDGVFRSIAFTKNIPPPSSWCEPIMTGTKLEPPFLIVKIREECLPVSGGLSIEVRPEETPLGRAGLLPEEAPSGPVADAVTGWVLGLREGL